VKAIVQLDLFEDVESLPWYGRAPRTLTRGSIALFLERERQEDARYFADPDQVDMFRRRRKNRSRITSYPGSPLLVEPGRLQEGR